MKGAVTGRVDLRRGDALVHLLTLEDNSIDSVVTDPPYGIGFMGREWDTFTAGAAGQRTHANADTDSRNPNVRGRARSPAASPAAVEYDRSLKGQHAYQQWTEQWAREVYRVLKPGGHLVVFGAPRTHHRMMSGVEDAGFEIRDCVMWMFGQGFPKSLNLRGKWRGWGTALKPAWEPIVVARKPVEGTVAGNVQRYGVGGLNVDGCRIESRGRPLRELDAKETANNVYEGRVGGDPRFMGGSKAVGKTDLGRWPANVVLDEEAGRMLDAQFPSAGAAAPVKGTEPSKPTKDIYGQFAGRVPGAFYADGGGPSRFFYCPKVSRSEREFGCEHLPNRTPGQVTGGRKAGSAGLDSPRAGAGRTAGGRNHHPTVKPIALMRWLVRLVTPPGGTALDIFMGSGSTGVAAALEGFGFVGFDKEREWVEVAKARIEAWGRRQQDAQRRTNRRQ